MFNFKLNGGPYVTLLNIPPFIPCSCTNTGYFYKELTRKVRYSSILLPLCTILANNQIRGSNAGNKHS